MDIITAGRTVLNVALLDETFSFASPFGTVSFCKPDHVSQLRQLEHADPDDCSEIVEHIAACGIVLDSIHRHWWIEASDCEGGPACRCGRIALHEVVTLAPEALRQDAIETHVKETREAWQHYWSGDCGYSDAQRGLGAICVACITEGVPHVAEVGIEAETLSVEVGELIARFSGSLSVDIPTVSTRVSDSARSNDKGC